ncbi:NAD-dependent succinate-semialdehyde dehydrogenase [Pseudomonas gingeri]|uniref:NAD-dependent succinate-semialdehyde dehydrogenase n=1 Tax=Pseudomonas gingeri TaxID=117681 RepID=UPI0015A16B37|nr:NAD-dependent succinate-semialdehyde dehydrogenase [Pseudomonas gingeri]NWD04135.1 NAD-dependent succinate-semialdehyde dehydrogenase [Pseudomonas gingeri]NWE34233.1 NAD-dependent succinate-semialdehyde dehydrogenase [Pseudomonas gingeri]NWE56515.1 NAD-dependent succinate-semialdehyde dehydrogenase [Pseudomonas gingeri]NWF05731.1 NAD-dependent succinate-semialdehyde dehydrogenase [Pseudomonas gingeri]
MFKQIKASGWLREKNYIAGEWVPADNGDTYSVDDPATGQIIGSIAWSGRAETRRAISAAHEAFPGWAATTAADRSKLLLKMAEIIRENSEMLASLLTLEQGKPISEARAEIAIGAGFVQWFAEEARRINGDIVPSPWKGRRILVTREPVGVVGAIAPWNFPFLMLARKVAAALAAGCTIVVKPSEFTPYCGLLWGIIAEKAGLPASVLNVITGEASQVGAELTSNPLVRKITFTGSTRVGKLLFEQSAQTMKRLSLELGGNAPFIVFNDADLDSAVQGALVSKYRNAGQTCICTNRFYIQSGIYEEFSKRFVEAVRQLKVGNGFDAEVQQGPLINQGAVKKVQAHLNDALGKGARLLLGGSPHPAGANFFEPTVLADATSDMLIANEETFGPLSALFKFENEQDAVDAANASEFGLAAYFYTRDLARTFRVAAALEYGMVGINEGLITTEVAPFGGVKDSGVGREGSTHGLDDYLSLKYMSLGGL